MRAIPTPRDLQLDYSVIDANVEARSVVVAQQARLANDRAVTFIPSVIAEDDTFWKLLAL